MSTGAFYRSNPSLEGDGTIYWQETPTSALVAIMPLQWDAYSNNGNRFVDYSPEDIATLTAKFK